MKGRTSVEFHKKHTLLSWIWWRDVTTVTDFKFHEALQLQRLTLQPTLQIFALSVSLSVKVAVHFIISGCRYHVLAQ